VWGALPELDYALMGQWVGGDYCYYYCSVWEARVCIVLVSVPVT